MVILDVITAVFGGGITGLVGTVTTAVINYKTQKIKNEHEVAMERVKIDTMKAQAEIAKGLVSDVGKEVKDAMASATEVQDSIAYGKSQQFGNEQVFSSNWIEKLLQVKGWTSWFSFPIAYIIIILFGIVDFMKGLMRPGITLYMMGASTWITMLAYRILEKAGIEKMDIADAANIFNSVVVVITYLTISCVTWWFGDRRTAKFLMRLKDGNFKLEGESKDDKKQKDTAPF
jgi:hypothetical protein